MISKPRLGVAVVGMALLVASCIGCGALSEDPTKRLSGKLVAKCAGHTAAVTEVDISPDGKLVVSAGDHTLRF